jgi:predicted GNAT family N-acyltransferase
MTGAVLAERAARSAGGFYPWCGVWVRASQLSARDGDELERLRSFRAEVLYDGGRRPQFRACDGRYVDDQDLDPGSYHITVSDEPGGVLLAYARLSPPELTGLFQTRRLVGDAQFAALAEGIPEDRVCEAGRLVVAHGSRGQKLAIVVAGVFLAVVRRLGYSAVVAVSGVRDGQFRLYERFGFHLAPGVRAYSAQYEDELCVVVQSRPGDAGEIEPLVREVNGLMMTEPFAPSGPSAGG